MENTNNGATKITIGDKTFWHQLLKDGVATIRTYDKKMKQALYSLHRRFPDAVQLMYDGDDLCAEDFDGTTTFYLDSQSVELFIKPGVDNIGFRVYESEPDIEVIDHEEGDVI